MSAETARVKFIAGEFCAYHSILMVSCGAQLNAAEVAAKTHQSFYGMLAVWFVWW